MHILGRNTGLYATQKRFCLTIPDNMSTRTVLQTPPQVPVVAEPRKQRQLLLHGARQPYEVEHNRDVPEVFPGELLVRVQAIGLNPIDWKSA
jgi:hypothetical protein